MKEQEVYAVVPAKKMNNQDRAYAIRMGILIEPRWGSSYVDVSENKPDEMLPAADIKSRCILNVESRSGNKHRR